MPLTGKALIIAGVVLVAVGLFVSFGPKVPLLGRLPGDIVIQRENFTFSFPLVTCILLSIIITLLLRLFGR